MLAPPLAACTCATVLPRELRREAAEELAARTRLKPAEVKALYARFRRLAPAGFLLPEQFRQTMGVLGLSDDHFLPDRLFRVFDTNQDGQLCFVEFATSLAVMLRGTEDEKLRLSFEMAAGTPGASGITLEDFRHLINTCSAMKSNLVAPSSGMPSEEDIQRLFRDVANAAGEEHTEAGVITLEAYKAAVHGNGEFLACLGLGVRPMTSPAPEPAAERRRTWSSAPPTPSKAAAAAPPPAAAGGQSEGHVILPTGELAELLGHVEGLRRAMHGAAGDDAVVVADEVEDCAFDDQVMGSSGDELPPPPVRTEPRRKSLPHSEDVAGGPLALDGLVSVARACYRVLEGALWALPSCRPQSAEREPGEVSFGRRSIIACGCPELDEELPTAARGPTTTPPVGYAVQEEVAHLLSWCRRHGGGCDAVPGRGDCSGKCREACQGGAGFAGVLPGSAPASPRASARGGAPGHHAEALTRMGSSAGGVNANASNLSRRPSFLIQRSGDGLGGGRRRRTQHRLRLLGPKKGLAVHFGHENWNLVLSMMIGIRMSIGRCRHEIPRELQPVDFVMKEKFSIIPRLTNIFDSAASKRITITRFIDYAPMVFQRIRSSFGIQHDEYLRSVGPEQLLGNMVLGNLSSLAELSSEGKSGAFFYYTADGRYMMKTVAPKEYHLLKQMLSRYYDHIMQSPGTLIVRFLGLHCLSIRERRRGSKGAHHTVQKLYFVVMANMFNTPFEIHRRYDIKGSWVGRVTPHDQRDRTVALKDVDFTEANESIRVGEEAAASLLAQIEKDSAFLRENNIIDYSLLLGIHDVGATCTWDGGGLPPNPSIHGPAECPLPGPPAPGGGPQVPGYLQVPERVHSPASCSPVSGPRGLSMHSDRPFAATASAATSAPPPLHQRDLGGILSSDRKSLYFIGIIDILTPYDSAKKLEHSVKALLYDGRGVSCCEPGFYAERFVGFLRNALV